LVSQLGKKKDLGEVLVELQQEFRLGGIALRDEKETVLLAVPPDFLPVLPKDELNSVTLFPTEEKIHRYGSKGFRLPEEGGRIVFKTDRNAFSFDLWEGDPRGLDLEMRQTLAIALLILAFQLSGQSIPRRQG
jgi:hypothetical protein